MSQGNFWSFTLCEYPAVNHAYRACCALSCQMNPTGNGKILQSIYLLGLKTRRTASAHLTLQKRLDRPAVLCSLACRHTTFNTLRPLQKLLMKEPLQKSNEELCGPLHLRWLPPESQDKTHWCSTMSFHAL